MLDKDMTYLQLVLSMMNVNVKKVVRFRINFVFPLP